MSTMLYGALTAKREAAEANTSTTTKAPATKPYVDALAALVPAEVLIIHGVVLGFSTSTTIDDPATEDVVEPTTSKVTDPTTLKWVFIALAVTSVVFYVAARLTAKDPSKKAPSLGILFGQCLIPPAAFALWTMLQPISAFDGFWPDLELGPRQTIAVIGAALVSFAAGFLGYRLDKADPKNKTAG